MQLAEFFVFSDLPVLDFLEFFGSQIIDVGQGYNRPKTGDQGQGFEPWTHKKIVLQGQGLKPCTHRKIVLQDQGFEPWTNQKDRSMIVHTIAYTIARAIVIINVHTKASSDAQTSSMWNVSAG